MFDYYFKYGVRYSLKYIIRFILRLLIVFGIIFLISLFKGNDLLIVNTNAQELVQSPKKMIVYQPNQESQELSFSSFSKSSVLFYGWNFATYQSRESIGFIYDTPLNLKNKSADLNFVIYNDLWSNQVKPDRVIVKNNSSGAINSCVVSSSSKNFSEGTLTQPGSKFNTVICENVILTDDEFQIYLFDNFESSSNTLVGISRLFLKINSTSSTSDISSSVDDINDSIKDDNVDSSTSQGSSFFDDFDAGSEGSLTDIVSLPLQYVQSLNDSCKPFTFPLGKMGGNITIPCLSSVWSKTSFSSVINTAKLILNGFICYKLLVSLFLFFKDLKDPDNDKVEVMNL